MENCVRNQTKFIETLLLEASSSHKIKITIQNCLNWYYQYYHKSDQHNIAVLMEHLLDKLKMQYTADIFIENVKTLLWCLIRKVYVRNTKLWFINHRYEDIDKYDVSVQKLLNIVPTFSSIYECSKRVYRKHYLYELNGDTVSLAELFLILIDFNKCV